MYKLIFNKIYKYNFFKNIILYVIIYFLNMKMFK